MKTAAKGLLGGAVIILAASVALAGKPVPQPPTPTVSGMKVYAGGELAGYVLSLYHGGYGDYLTIISETGYLAEFFAHNGEFLPHTDKPVQIVYTGLNCTGDAYAYMAAETGAWKLQQGMVFTLASQTYYTSKVTQRQGTYYWSAMTEYGSCGNLNQQQTAAPVAPAFLNDVAITGIPSEGLAQPIVFGIP